MKVDLNDSQVNTLKESGWLVGPVALTKTFKITGYKNVIALSNSIFNIAEKLNHHPDLNIKYGSIEVSIFSHNHNSITKLCYDFAVEVNLVASS